MATEAHKQLVRDILKNHPGAKSTGFRKNFVDAFFVCPADCSQCCPPECREECFPECQKGCWNLEEIKESLPHLIPAAYRIVGDTVECFEASTTKRLSNDRKAAYGRFFGVLDEYDHIYLEVIEIFPGGHEVAYDSAALYLNDLSRRLSPTPQPLLNEILAERGA
jgi:hypothetical protein